MAQTSIRSNVSKVLTTAALGGMIVGSAALLSGCMHDKDAGDQGTSMNAGQQHSCKGQNACKGQGNCKTSDHSCKGQNSCKGQGGCKST